MHFIINDCVLGLVVVDVEFRIKEEVNGGPPVQCVLTGLGDFASLVFTLTRIIYLYAKANHS